MISEIRINCIYKNNFVYTPIFFSTWYHWLTLSVIKNQLLISWNDFNNSTNSMFDITISIFDISKYLDIISEIKWEISATPEQILFWRFHYNDVIMDAMASQITSRTTVYSSAYSGADKKKTSKLRVTGLCEGNSPVTGEFPVQRASNTENVSTWWRHHAYLPF